MRVIKKVLPIGVAIFILGIALEFKVSREAGIVFIIMSAFCCLFAPLLFLSPQAKAVYLPISFVVLAISLIGGAYYFDGFGILFFVSIWGILGSIFVSSQLRVCPDCGKIVGLHRGRSEEHNCANKSPEA